MKQVVTKITIATILTMAALPVYAGGNDVGNAGDFSVANEGDSIATVRILGDEAVLAGQAMSDASRRELPSQNAVLVTGEKIQCLLKLNNKGEVVAAGSFCNIGLNTAGVTSLNID